MRIIKNSTTAWQSFIFIVSKFWIRPLVITLALLFTHPTVADNGRFDQMIQDLIHEKLSDDSIIVEFALESKSKLDELRRKEGDIDNIQLTSFSPSSSSFRIKVRMHDGTTQEIFGRYTSYVELPVALKQIRVGDIISVEDVTTAKTRLNHTKTGYALSIENLIGMQAKKNLQSGAPIKLSDVAPPHVIHDGDIVSLIYQNNHLKLKTLGTAIGSGSIGDIIKATNNTSGIIVHGRVQSKNVIEVSAE
ncbi:MAG: flagellar basal body P-ring formation chaperone FlgA [Pseudomonadota bacterium]